MQKMKIVKTPHQYTLSLSVQLFLGNRRQFFLKKSKKEKMMHIGFDVMHTLP
jgi:hypothetical protein